MSKNVMIEVEDGVWEPMDIKNMQEKYRNCRMRCNGEIKQNPGMRCDAPMYAKRSRRDGSFLYFAEHERLKHPHRDGCEQARPAQNTIISHYDQKAAHLKSEDFLNQLFATEKRKDSHRKGSGPDGQVESRDEGKNQEDERGVKPIKRIAALPGTFVAIVKLLASLNINHVFMDRMVKDWIVDRRTFSYHFHHGHLNGQTIVVAKLCSPSNLEIARSDNEWILADCSFSEDPEGHWFYRLKCDKKTLSKIERFRKRPNRQNKYVVVCSRWKQAPEKHIVFNSDNLTCKRVAFVNKKDIDRYLQL